MPVLCLLLLLIIHVICPQQTVANGLIRRQRNQGGHHDHGHGHESHMDAETGYSAYRHPRMRHKTPQQYGNQYEEDIEEDDYGYAAANAMMGPGVDDLADVDDDSEGDDEVKVSDKSQLTAFALSLLFGGFGAGRWYIGDYGLAAVKLILFLVICCTPCIAVTCGGAGTTIQALASGDAQTDSGGLAEAFGCCTMLSGCLVSCAAPALTVWYIVDIVLFAFNLIPDQNGLPLNWKTIP